MQTVFDDRINGHPGKYVRIAGWRLEEVRTISQHFAIPKEISCEQFISRSVETQEIFNLPEETIWVEPNKKPKQPNENAQYPKHKVQEKTRTANSHHFYGTRDKYIFVCL